MANTSLVVISTISVVLAVLSTLTPRGVEALTDHQLMLLQGGGMNGKRSQTGMEPQEHFNWMEDAVESEERRTGVEQNPLALYRNLSPAKSHMLSKLLELARMNNELSDE